MVAEGPGVLGTCVGVERTSSSWSSSPSSRSCRRLFLVSGMIEDYRSPILEPQGNKDGSKNFLSRSRCTRNVFSDAKSKRTALGRLSWITRAGGEYLG
ncbi:hypothetical protein L596_006220 [Steinernema carpocapsae]|uniref:Uncharacterized protein n=1 Tax=Steinernema carpocapsae TaxID=34508 RepID=A0A4U8V343_STECR|nr:hypothetical protein L596_006220 [Steinernema carpocapsae]